MRVGDLDRAERSSRAQKTYRRYLVRIGIVAALVLALVGGGLAVYYSNLFTIENVSVTGVEHLTATDMSELASVPPEPRFCASTPLASASACSKTHGWTTCR